MSWQLYIKDSSGQHSCDSCTKDRECASRSVLEAAVETLCDLGDDVAVHPAKTGWGQVEVCCRGFQLAEVLT